MRTILQNARVVDETGDTLGSVVIEDGLIAAVLSAEEKTPAIGSGDRLIDGGGNLVLMPAFVELHAHFRDPGFPDKENLESACLAAVAGGYGSVVCMANTKPVMDDPAAASALRSRADALDLIDLFPALSLTRGMEGRDTSHLADLSTASGAIRLLSEDGKDVISDGVFREAFRRAAALGIPVSCHCDAPNPEAAAAKASGAERSVWSRLEEDFATKRALTLARAERCSVHIAHVSTQGALEAVRAEKAAPGSRGGITAEVSPHHLVLTEVDADALGREGVGRVNPPLRSETDRLALIEGLLDGTIDAIATDHAPHTAAEKAAGAPGFSGLETAFAVCRTELVRPDRLNLSQLSSLMSAAPARILGLSDRGRIAVGLKADLVLVDVDELWTVDPSRFRSKGRNSPFAGRHLRGRVVTTLRRGRIVYDRRKSK